MKKFTMIILAIGVLTLIFYALNPVEEFELYTRSLDFEELIRKYTSLTPEQQQAIKDQTELLRQQTGIASGNSGASNPYANQPIDTDAEGNPINASYPGTPSPAGPVVTARQTSDQSMNRFRGEFTGQFVPSLYVQQQTDQVISSDKMLPSIMRNTTPASMLQAKKDEKNASTIMSPEPGCGTQPVKNNSNYNDILEAQISAKEAQDAKTTRCHKKKLEELQTLHKKKQLHQRAEQQEMQEMQNQGISKGVMQQNQKLSPVQVQYIQKYCPPPDPQIWIKRKEIPCWGCSV
uniref:Uncharacterized protein n=1 Tax=viral metagenome TaxID=1070528 RepID=A0A6C0BH44_9ZZZZ